MHFVEKTWEVFVRFCPAVNPIVEDPQWLTVSDVEPWLARIPGATVQQKIIQVFEDWGNLFPWKCSNKTSEKSIKFYPYALWFGVLVFLELYVF